MWNICGWSAWSCSCVRSYSCHPAENPPRMKEHQQTILLWHHKQLQTINVPASRQPLPRRRAAASGGCCSLAQSCLRIALFPWFPLKTNRWRREAGGREREREREILHGSYSFNMQAFQFLISIFEVVFFLYFHWTTEETAQLPSSPLNLFMCVNTLSGLWKCFSCCTCCECVPKSHLCNTSTQHKTEDGSSTRSNSQRKILKACCLP